MTKKFFGTDGVRGMANVYPMTPELAMSLGQAVAIHFKNQKTTQRIVIGKDTRRSSYMFELAIAAGVCSMGLDAVLLGPMSTPGVAYITKAMRATAGIMISASHNAYHDNGIKFFDRNGYKLTDSEEKRIEGMILNGVPLEGRPTGEQIGKAKRVDDALGRYVEFVKSTFPQNLSLEGLKVVLDCANGAAYKLAPMALVELGAEVIPIGVHPNGTNINQYCGALHPETMTEVVKNQKADLGIALDGDADRLILCDENGEVIDGDKVIALCAIELNKKKALHNNTVVGTIMTNLGVENYLAKMGIHLERTQVGDRYILEKMKADDIVLGGEPSGHIIFKEHATTGDGLIAALQVLSEICRTGKKLSELVEEIPLYPQVSEAITVKEKKPLESLKEFQKTWNDVNQTLNGNGRTVVRYSGTEPVLRLMVEGEDSKLIRQELGRLTESAKSELT